MIKNKLKTLPLLPGVYIFKSISRNPIYIGKAKSLKKRVSSYFQKNLTSWKTNLLIEEIDTIDHITTKTELEASLLEAELIRKYQPKFNILLKDGQPFVFIMRTNERLPQLKLVRHKKEKGTYFGPFLYKGQARSIYNFLINTFRLKLCNKKIDQGCLQYHLGKCAGLCTKSFNEKEYLFRLNLVISILRGKTKNLEENIKKEIALYNKNLLFEQSKKLNHILEDLNNIIHIIKNHFNPDKYKIQEKSVFEKTFIDHPKIGSKIASLLKLKTIPTAIDCFDISHLQSCHMVGSCIRFSDGIPDKNNFRKFKINTLEKQNDCAALKEIVQRRYKKEEALPDIVMIDGGKGQRSIIQKLLPKITVISLAKRDEKLFSSYYKNGIIINTKTDEGRTLIALRDYAHHFAITYHKKKRGALLKKS